ncbi:MAG: DUF551 domain-containing protein [Acidobacteriota bacterium]
MTTQELKPKCDGNHGGPRCADPECWNDSPVESEPHGVKAYRLAKELCDHLAVVPVVEPAAVLTTRQPEPAGEAVAQGSARHFIEWCKAQPEDREPTTLEGALAEFEATHPPAPTPAPAAQEVGLTDAWFSIDEKKPPTNKPVLIHYLNEHQRSQIVRAHYIPAKTVEANEDDATEEYDAETDTYYVQAGWYEDNSESEVNYGITGNVTHWRDLPPVPAPIAALRAKEGK